MSISSLYPFTFVVKLTILVDMNDTLTKTRKSVSARLRGLEIPDVFAAATVASAARSTQRTRRADARDGRRLNDQVKRLSFPGGPVDLSRFRTDDAPTRTTIGGEQVDLEGR